MKKKLLNMLLAVFFLFFITSVSHATIIVDFEDLGIAIGSQWNPGPGSGVISRGFNYTAGPNNTSGLNDMHISNQESFNASNGTTVGITHDDVILTRVNGGVFHLLSFDFAGHPTNFESPFSVLGLFQGGGSISANFTPDGIVDSFGGNPDYQTFLLSSAWHNLASVTWNDLGQGSAAGIFSLDNIVVEPVPEPATMFLLGTGLVGIAGTVRRRKKM